MSDQVDTEILYTTKEEASSLLEGLTQILANKGRVSARDLNEFLTDEEDDYTDDDSFGWYSLDGAKVVEIESGWLAILPDPVTF